MIQKVTKSTREDEKQRMHELVVHYGLWVVYSLYVLRVGSCEGIDIMRNVPIDLRMVSTRIS